MTKRKILYTIRFIVESQSVNYTIFIIKNTKRITSRIISKFGIGLFIFFIYYYITGLASPNTQRIDDILK